MTNFDSGWYVNQLQQRIPRDSAPVLLHDAAAEIVYENGYSNDLNSAFDIAADDLKDIRLALIEVQRAAEAQGTAWIIETFGSQHEWVRGAAYDDPTLTSLERMMRSRRASDRLVKSELQKLTYREFEFACTTVLEELGCENPRTSPGRDDGGIDFYGRLSLKGRLNSNLPLGGIDQRVNIWLIGQAKHYPTRPIQTADLRELVGSVELARTKGAIHTWLDLTMQPFDAVVMLFFTTGWFSAGSVALLEKSGMLAMTGDQLSTLLCDVGIGFDDVSGSFNSAAFRTALLKDTGN